MMSHRYFHDAYRIACLLQLKCFVLNLPPDALIIRSLARNALSLLETMEMLSLPGFVSSHWILFTVAICCTSHGERSGSDSSPASALLPDDRQRADKLYETVMYVADLVVWGSAKTYTVTDWHSSICPGRDRLSTRSGIQTKADGSWYIGSV